MSGYPLRDRIALAAAVLVPAAVALALVPFRTELSLTNAALILVVTVVAVAANGNRTAGALAALSSAAWFDFFLTRPYQQFTITDGDDIETAVLLLVVGLLVSQLAARVRRLHVVTVTDAGHLARIHETARLAGAPGGSAEAVVDHVKRQLTELLQLRGCRFQYGSLLGRPPRLEQDGSVSEGGGMRDVEREGWPAEEVELRVTADGHYVGRFMLQPTPGAVPPLPARLVAVTLAGQAGAAHDTVRTSDG